MELFKEVFNQPELLITFAFDMLSISKDLPVNMTDITDEETERAIKALKNNKAAALDEISAELLKHGGPTWPTFQYSWRVHRSTNKPHEQLLERKVCTR